MKLIQVKNCKMRLDGYTTLFFEALGDGVRGLRRKSVVKNEVRKYENMKNRVLSVFHVFEPRERHIQIRLDELIWTNQFLGHHLFPGPSWSKFRFQTFVFKG